MASTKEPSDPNLSPTIVVYHQTRQHQKYVGVACKALSGKEDGPPISLSVYEFMDSDQFSNLDGLLVQLGPSDLILEQNSEGFAALAALAGRHGARARGAPRGAFRAADLPARLPRLLGLPAAAAARRPELELQLGRAALAALLQALEGGSSGEGEGEGEGELDGRCSLRVGDLESFLVLDSAAAEAVNLLPDPRHPNRYGSLFGVLNHCRTRGGERLLRRWLRQPLRALDRLRARQARVAALVDGSAARGELQDGALKALPDAEALLARLAGRGGKGGGGGGGGGGGLPELFKLYVFALNVPKLAGALALLAPSSSSSAAADEGGEGDSEEAAALKARFLPGLQKAADDLRLFVELVEAVLDTSVFPELMINPRYDERLTELANELDEVTGEIGQLHEEANEGFARVSKGSVDIKLDANDKMRGHVFRLTKAALEKDLKKWRKDVHVCDVKKSGVLFTTPELKEAAKRHRELKAEYETQQAGLVAKACETAATYAPVFARAAALASELDALCSLAHAAALAPHGYCRPALLPADDEGGLRVEGGRHPCVELQEGVAFIPNDYELVRGESSLTLVTGPNMGGKSTYIRALGAIVVMAQVGSYVPAAAAAVPVRDRVLARVGAGDAQHQGVSTFMAEMLEAAAILRTATKDSLLIIDELGRGTSTFDGFGLAWAISEHLARAVGCPTLFATHFHELTALEDREASVRNKHVSAHVEAGKITFLYEVQPGPCLESFGIHVAEMAHFPPAVVASAKRKARELEGYKAMETGVKKFKEGGGGNKQQKQEAAEDGSTATDPAIKFLRDFAALPLDLMESGERLAAVRKVALATSVA